MLLLKDGFSIPVAFRVLQQQHGIEDGGKRVAKFVAEHRQKFIFAAVEIGHRPLLPVAEAAAFGDVTDVALNDLLMVFRIDIADELDFDLLPVALSSGKWS